MSECMRTKLSKELEIIMAEGKKTMPEHCERRIISVEDTELRETDGKPKIIRYAAKYGKIKPDW